MATETGTHHGHDFQIDYALNGSVVTRAQFYVDGRVLIADEDDPTWKEIVEQQDGQTTPSSLIHRVKVYIDRKFVK